MKPITLFAGFASIAAAISVCENNCGRAVVGTSRASPALSARQSMCSEFVTTTTTITPTPVTVTTGTVYVRSGQAARATDTPIPLPVITAEKPAYASACPDAIAYWSACQCFSDIAPTTVTETLPTPTETVPAATCTMGSEFAIYTLDEDSPRWQELELHGFNLQRVNFTHQFSGVEPNITGMSPTIGGPWSADFEAPIDIYGVTGAPGTAMARTIISQRGYLNPAVADFHHIFLDAADQGLYLWMRDTAVSGWRQNNAQIERHYPPNSNLRYDYLFDVRQSALGFPIPFRFLWFNVGGPGVFHASMHNLRGTSLFSRFTDYNSHILTGCSGPAAVVGPWTPWAEETVIW